MFPVRNGSGLTSPRKVQLFVDKKGVSTRGSVLCGLTTLGSKTTTMTDIRGLNCWKHKALSIFGVLLLLETSLTEMR